MALQLWVEKAEKEYVYGKTKSRGEGKTSQQSWYPAVGLGHVHNDGLFLFLLDWK